MRRICCLAVCTVFLITASTLLLSSAYADTSGDSKYTPEQIRNNPAEMFLARMLDPEPGYHQFAGMWALTEKAKESDADARQSMLSLVITVMKDKSRNIYQRWQCCYVISGCGYEQGVPDLIDVLFYDESEVMRSVAAEALAQFPNSQSAHTALVQSARMETSAKVREVLTRRLGAEMPPATPVVVSPARISVVIPNDAQRKSAEVLLQQIWQAAPGKPKFDAVDAVVRTCGEYDASDRKAILSLFIAAMKDRSLTITQRWPCCYVISRSGEEQGVAPLILVLLFDESETMRAVAAEALGGLHSNTAAYDALMQSAHKETSQWVRETLARYLGEAMPALDPK